MACKCEDNAMNSINNKDCIPFETPILPDRLARAYVPNQKICNLYEPMDALINGTVFPALNL